MSFSAIFGAASESSSHRRSGKCIVVSERPVAGEGCVDVASGDKDICNHPSWLFVMPNRIRMRKICAVRFDNVEKSVIRSEADLSTLVNIGLASQELLVKNFVGLVLPRVMEATVS